MVIFFLITIFLFWAKKNALQGRVTDKHWRSLASMLYGGISLPSRFIIESVRYVLAVYPISFQSIPKVR